MVTPLGSPVAPEVKRISATSSCAVGEKDAAGSRMSITSRRGQTGHPIASGASSASPIRSARALTIPAIRSTTLADERKSIGTATTPARIDPQRATTHSGRFSPHKRIRSPLEIPAARSFWANAVAAWAASSYVKWVAARSPSYRRNAPRWRRQIWKNAAREGGSPITC